MRIYCFFLFLGLPWLLLAQGGALEFKVYSFEEGLSHRNVFKVEQDQEGYLWVATINGLNRFDGIHFVSYSTSSSTHRLPYDYVSDLYIGGDSLIWLAHPNALSFLDPATNRIRLIETDEESAVYNREREPGGLCLSAGGNLFSVTYDNTEGSSYLQRVGEQSTLYDVAKLQGTFARRPLLGLANGNLLIGSGENELTEFNEQGERQRTYRLSDKKLLGFSSGWPTSLHQAPR